MDGRVRQPVGAAIPTAAPTNTYPCADGKWLCIAGNSDLIFARLMAAIGRPELAARPRLCHQRRPLRPARASWTRRSPPGPAPCRPREAEARLEAADVPCSRLFDIADCAADPHFRARDVGAGGGRPADRPHPASRPGDPPGRRGARGGGGLDRPGARRTHRIRAARTPRAAARAGRVTLPRPGAGGRRPPRTLLSSALPAFGPRPTPPLFPIPSLVISA